MIKMKIFAQIVISAANKKVIVIIKRKKKKDFTILEELKTCI